jgi:hypothetical protein
MAATKATKTKRKPRPKPMKTVVSWGEADQMGAVFTVEHIPTPEGHEPLVRMTIDVTGDMPAGINLTILMDHEQAREIAEHLDTASRND